MSSVEELTQLILTKGDEIRVAKSSNSSKESITGLVNDLLTLKEKYKELNNGIPYDPPKVESKKSKVEPALEPVRDGPSKKELNKLAKKERSVAYKESQKENGGSTTNTNVISTLASASASASVSTTSENMITSLSKTLSIPTTLSTMTSISSSHFPSVITYSKNGIPELTRTIISVVNADVTFTPSSQSNEHLPYLISDPSKGSISGDLNIAKYLVRSAGINAISLYGGNDPHFNSQVDEWLDFSMDMKLYHIISKPENVLDILNTHLAERTFIVGYTMTMADIAIVLVLKKSDFHPTHDSYNIYPNVNRWFQLISPQLPYPKPLTSKTKPTSKTANETSSSTSKSSSSSSSSSLPSSSSISTASATVSSDANASGEEGTCPPLEDAIDGQVCTRFPPEPSGYLHIGHCKAVLLNQYYAQRYHGKLIVRFDDTNPSKEKEEYEDNILKDLETLNVKADKVTHTSDHFDICTNLARKLILDGNGYMDDTDQETMQKERMELKKSIHRNSTPEENLKIFELLLKGDTSAVKYCLRAKIDMSSVNGTMRDPVMYRFNDTPHHRTGSKYKAYPTYDFACPIVDAIEGVTHALRTTEYNDRDEQYHWIQKALELRDVKIMTYGKVNFVNTVLSKRKLNWFVEQGLVEGWFDARFPTIQGCVRRGMNIEVLKHFILSQGASRRVITMEWDKFWAENKRVLEESCPRYMAVTSKDKAVIVLENVDPIVTGHTVQIHPQKPDHGMRVMRRYNRVWLDQIDAKTVKAGEEVTLLRWGNIKIRAIDTTTVGKDGKDNLVTTIYASYDPEATNFSKTKKFTWLADVDDVVPITIVEFDHLITKTKLGEDDDFKNFVNPNSRVEYSAIADPILRLLPSGTTIQLERKGFFRIDKAYGGITKPAVLFAIPDGKVQKPAHTDNGSSNKGK